MPVITRSQSKNFINRINSKQVVVGITTFEDQFYNEIKVLLIRLDLATGKENRMRVTLQIFEKINKDLPLIINSQSPNILAWKRFVCVIFNKINEFEDDYYSGNWDEIIDEILLDKFVGELITTKNFASEIIRNHSDYSIIDPDIIRAKNEVIRLDGIRPRRNIPRVNYTGMDVIEPKSEFDEITDIWADLSIKEDPDYEFEEDEDEEEQQHKWAKIYPELSIEEKSEITEHLSQLTEHNRVRRNIARVNYTGMDMSEDDEWLVDGNVKYDWSTTFPWERDEILDEDYVE